jgi:hypothetical protein
MNCTSPETQVSNLEHSIEAEALLIHLLVQAGRMNYHRPDGDYFDPKELAEARSAFRSALSFESASV